MDQYILRLKKKFTEDMGNAASEYLALGMEQFHRFRNAETTSKEIAIHTMSAAAELMLKCYVGDKNLGLIFTGIPTELKVLLTCPERIPAFFEWRKYHFGLRSESDNTIPLGECISSFYVFFPHLKQLYMPHLRFLEKQASSCSHNILPSLSRYDFDRIGYTVLQLVVSIAGDPSFSLLWYQPTDDDQVFLRDFAEQRLNRVETAIERAKHVTVNEGTTGAQALPGNWNRHTATCPVCGMAGVLEGYTELAVTEDEEGKYTSLDFFAVSFHCGVCGLTFNDAEELKLAHMNILYDRSDELHTWFGDREYDTDWYMD